jgi:cytochrome c oxidase assembly factor CtaG
MELVLDPGAVVLVAAAEALYLRALAVLRARGVVVPRFQVALWHMGIALWVIGFFSPTTRSATSCCRRTWPSTC